MDAADGHVKLTDFGLAKEIDESSRSNSIHRIHMQIQRSFSRKLYLSTEAHSLLKGLVAPKGPLKKIRLGSGPNGRLCQQMTHQLQRQRLANIFTYVAPNPWLSPPV
ncbi:hypothetical protein ACFE04_002457 [Oxalis oulophora]